MAHNSVANKWNLHGEVDNRNTTHQVWSTNKPTEKKREKEQQPQCSNSNEKGSRWNQRQQQHANIVTKLITVVVWIMRSIYAWLIG